MIDAYSQLHELGCAHSIEVWEGDQLVGGMYGVLTGGIYTGESMFCRRQDASRVAVVDFAARLNEAGGVLLDTQVSSPHLSRLGAVEMSREQFLELLYAVRDHEIDLPQEKRDAGRLAG
jgi:leucyl/phenylalanyl-tRNA--protein transferase